MEQDIKYMKLALKLAAKGRGNVKQNPMVGAVIVKNGVIIGTGYHKEYGKYHAERNAILKVKNLAFGSTLYVNLEPCNHHGKTPPCTDIIIRSGIRRVVIGSLDPNPMVCKRGVRALRKANIKVDVGCLKTQCEKLNEIFFYNMKSRLPFVGLKFGMTADGKIATIAGNSKWITNEIARKHAHYLRSIYSAILVGVNTVILDNPSLNCRLFDKNNPVRIICDTNLKTPLNSTVVKTAKTQKTYIACSVKDDFKIREFEKAGVEIINVEKVGNHIDILQLMRKLYELGIDSVLVEGGAEINYSFLESGLINAIYSYIAPKLVGGNLAKTPIGGKGIGDLNLALNLKMKNLRLLGDNVLLEYRNSVKK